MNDPKRFGWNDGDIEITAPDEQSDEDTAQEDSAPPPTPNPKEA